MSAVLVAGAVLLGAAALWELAGSRGGARSLDTRRRGCPQRRAGADAGRRRAVASHPAAPSPGRPGGASPDGGRAGRKGGRGRDRAPCLPPWPRRRCPPGWRSCSPSRCPPPGSWPRRRSWRGRRGAAARGSAWRSPTPWTCWRWEPRPGAARNSPRRDLERRERAAGGELAVAVAEIECGVPQREALAAIRERVPGAELGAMASALERSRRYGSPLAEQLHEQAASLRRQTRRRISEQAARAAPKIQLVVALCSSHRSC